MLCAWRSVTLLQSVNLWQSVTSIMKFDILDKEWHPWKSVTSMTKSLFDNVWHLWQILTSLTKCYICDKVWHPRQIMTSVKNYDICEKVWHLWQINFSDKLWHMWQSWHPWQSVTSMIKCDIHDNLHQFVSVQIRFLTPLTKMWKNIKHFGYILHRNFYNCFH